MIKLDKFFDIFDQFLTTSTKRLDLPTFKPFMLFYDNYIKNAKI